MNSVRNERPSQVQNKRHAPVQAALAPRQMEGDTLTVQARAPEAAKAPEKPASGPLEWVKAHPRLTAAGIGVGGIGLVAAGGLLAASLPVAGAVLGVVGGAAAIGTAIWGLSR